MTQFHLQLNNNVTIYGEYSGNLSSQQAVILVHGFGVKRDSRGMFTDLGNALEDDYLVVKFDLVGIDDNGDTHVYDYQTQAEMLEKVIEFVRSGLDDSRVDRVNKVYIVAHSQGCMITGLLFPDNIDKIILASSPTRSPYQRMKTFFGLRPGSEIDESGTSKIARANGTFTYIDSSVWQGIKDIRPVELYRELIKKSEVYFIRAMDDEVVGNDPYEELRGLEPALSADRSEGLHYQELPGDHNFTGDYRNSWMKSVLSLL